MKRFLSGGTLDLNQDTDHQCEQQVDDGRVDLGKQVSDFYRKSVEHSSTVQPLYYRNKQCYVDQSTTAGDDSNNSNKSFYCPECEIDVTSSYVEHITSTIHNVSVREKANFKPKKYYHISSQNVGYKMLKDSYGWTEEQGLGRDNQGVLDPIKVVKKNDKLGVGKERPAPTTANVATAQPYPNKKQRRLKMLRDRLQEEKIRNILQDH
ncbi:hypothetical protein CYY_001629 [Polysphondylium violaceum]|uniref:G-patch domain-containing protein n=1 Tax=Polysphondylium violaceum TaxID=133409 RepID=A0A8J4Q1M5_9MYCE|nr:hypothetical protein CYY_001629 [Polysphondylium violaceum]